MFPLILQIASWWTELDPQLILGKLGTIASLGLLEAVLSADNALALAGLVKDQEPALQQRVLNWGLVLAFLFRILMILLAIWIMRYNVIGLIGGAYLIWLASQHFQGELSGQAADASNAQAQAGGPGLSLRLIGLVALTDLAFSLDSVSAAIAVTQERWLVLTGAGIGVLMLRFLAGWVIGWMDRFSNLKNAAYLTVFSVGLKLVAKALAPALVPDEGLMMGMIALFFLWGFSQSAENGEPPASQEIQSLGNKVLNLPNR